MSDHPLLATHDLSESELLDPRLFDKLSYEGGLASRAINNPYWDAVKNLPHDDLASWRNDGRFYPRSYPEIGAVRRQRLSGEGVQLDPETSKAWDTGPSRTELVKKYAFAIPSPATLEWLVEKLDGRPVLEVGAGTGYWAWMLTQMGIDVIAADNLPPNEGKNGYFSYRTEYKDVWEKLPDGGDRVIRTEERISEPGPVYHPITKVKAYDLRYLRQERERALLLIWPPYASDMADRVLQAYKGDTVFYVGEGEGGCTGNDAFHQRLGKHWQYEDDDPGFVSWSMINDRLEMYTRRKGVKT